jgi:hypothetical protein
MKKKLVFSVGLLFVAAYAALKLGAQGIYVPDSGTPLVETMSATDPAPGSCLFSVKQLNYTTGHEWVCVGAPGSQVWTDLSSVTPASSTVNSNPPATSSSAGTTGTITWDSNYIYVAVAPNTWKRAALSTF